jgi:hypothetical protein
LLLLLNAVVGAPVRPTERSIRRGIAYVKTNAIAKTPIVSTGEW